MGFVDGTSPPLGKIPFQPPPGYVLEPFVFDAGPIKPQEELARDAEQKVRLDKRLAPALKERKGDITKILQRCLDHINRQLEQGDDICTQAHFPPVTPFDFEDLDALAQHDFTIDLHVDEVDQALETLVSALLSIVWDNVSLENERQAQSLKRHNEALHDRMELLEHHLADRTRLLSNCRFAYFQEISHLRNQLYQKDRTQEDFEPTEAYFFDPTEYLEEKLRKLLNDKIKNSIKEYHEQSITMKAEIEELQLQLERGEYFDPTKSNDLQRVLQAQYSKHGWKQVVDKLGEMASKEMVAWVQKHSPKPTIEHQSSRVSEGEGFEAGSKNADKMRDALLQMKEELAEETKLREQAEEQLAMLMNTGGADGVVGGDVENLEAARKEVALVKCELERERHRFERMTGRFEAQIEKTKAKANEASAALAKERARGESERQSALRRLKTAHLEAADMQSHASPNWAKLTNVRSALALLKPGGLGSTMMAARLSENSEERTDTGDPRPSLTHALARVAANRGSKPDADARESGRAGEGIDVSRASTLSPRVAKTASGQSEMKGKAVEGPHRSHALQHGQESLKAPRPPSKAGSGANSKASARGLRRETSQSGVRRGDAQPGVQRGTSQSSLQPGAPQPGLQRGTSHSRLHREQSQSKDSTGKLATSNRRRSAEKHDGSESNYTASGMGHGESGDLEQQLASSAVLEDSEDVMNTSDDDVSESGIDFDQMSKHVSNGQDMGIAEYADSLLDTIRQKQADINELQSEVVRLAELVEKLEGEKQEWSDKKEWHPQLEVEADMHQAQMVSNNSEHHSTGSDVSAPDAMTASVPDGAAHTLPRSRAMSTASAAGSVKAMSLVGGRSPSKQDARSTLSEVFAESDALSERSQFASEVASQASHYGTGNGTARGSRPPSAQRRSLHTHMEDSDQMDSPAGGGQARRDRRLLSPGGSRGMGNHLQCRKCPQGHQVELLSKNPCTVCGRGRSTYGCPCGCGYFLCWSCHSGSSVQVIEEAAVTSTSPRSHHHGHAELSGRGRRTRKVAMEEAEAVVTVANDTDGSKYQDITCVLRFPFGEVDMALREELEELNGCVQGRWDHTLEHIRASQRPPHGRGDGICRRGAFVRLFQGCRHRIRRLDELIAMANSIKQAEMAQMLEGIHLLMESTLPDDDGKIRDYIFGRGFTSEALKRTSGTNFEKLGRRWDKLAYYIVEQLLSGTDDVELAAHPGRRMFTGGGGLKGRQTGSPRSVGAGGGLGARERRDFTPMVTKHYGGLQAHGDIADVEQEQGLPTEVDHRKRGLARTLSIKSMGEEFILGLSDPDDDDAWMDMHVEGFAHERAQQKRPARSGLAALPNLLARSRVELGDLEAVIGSGIGPARPSSALRRRPAADVHSPEPTVNPTPPPPPGLTTIQLGDAVAGPRRSDESIAGQLSKASQRSSVQSSLSSRPKTAPSGTEAAKVPKTAAIGQLLTSDDLDEPQAEPAPCSSAAEAALRGALGSSCPDPERKLERARRQVCKGGRASDGPVPSWQYERREEERRSRVQVGRPTAGVMRHASIARSMGQRCASAGSLAVRGAASMPTASIRVSTVGVDASTSHVLPSVTSMK